MLLVEDSSDYATLVQRWLQDRTDKRSAFTLNWADTLESGLRRLAAGGLDVILLDLGLPDSDGAATFAAVRDHCGSTPVIVLSGADNEPLALEMIQEGAADYLVKTSCTEDLLRRALRYAVARGQASGEAERAEKRSRIISIAGCKGGTGTTTFACCLAADLRFVSEGQVLLADLDLVGRSVEFVTGVTPQYTLRDAFLNFDVLDQDMWSSIVTQNRGGPDILTAPPFPFDKSFDAADIHRLFRKIHRYYDWIVLDVGRLDPFALSVAEWSNEVMLVTTQSLASLSDCKQTVKLMRDQGRALESMSLIVNRKESLKEIPEKELQNMFGAPVRGWLPSAAFELHEALLQSRLPSASGAYRQAVTRVARRLGGLPEEKPGRLRSQLSSIAGRFRGRPHLPEASNQ
ncbi:MAG: response regulator [Bryobacteraceae bacterium]